MRMRIRECVTDWAMIRGISPAVLDQDIGDDVMNESRLLCVIVLLSCIRCGAARDEMEKMSVREVEGR